ncbi:MULTISPECIES: 2-hydroxychromene-2-carboxylate isomerase [Paraburkholderia]|uniref:2-hydroxychromene-2-carboxylate isomerase n=1 Tax=Paraburkholderia TaxID=1822464 RepID=UPI00224DFB09|nr:MULTISPECIES: 2-hydroxychromene-2-carboxylate isomerase [Paraburkholderia]MCX4163090.1 2-hydroxychromene-2-carboxylate isomerase [Paraburkholderia megapolitana]MDN7158586.1 2-hydroxychromene-2-carboxylate isomerase [Paraburkholderia sp. CHISQ3]MDQ6495633.1 2-hydroxychromene-2-carboxylate isomerase [Paraburkholderia megapolitana]
MTTDASADNRATKPATIDFWFDFASNYSYLSIMRIEAAAAQRGVTVRWQPFLLGPIFQALGYDTSPFVAQKEKGAYVWQDMVRECRKYGLQWVRPSAFPRHSLLALRVALVGARQPWIGEYCRQITLRNFAQDRDIASADDVGDVLAQLGLPAAQILADAQGDENKLGLRRQTERAQAKGIFGAPMFFVGDEMFWGNDRLDDALAFCASPNA